MIEKNRTMIHKTAIIDEKVKLGKNVKIGPYSIINSNVTIGDNTDIKSHVVIDSNTKIGSNCNIFQYASVGAEPQDLKFKGEESFLEVGDNTTIREFATLNRGTENGGSLTKVGNNVLLMAYSHIAHDCILGNNVILANSANLAGHVTIEDNAIVGGLVGVHQFVKIGRFAFIGGKTAVMKDVPPFVIAAGVEQANVHGLNSVGLKRHGFSDDVIAEIKKVYRVFFRFGLPLSDAIKEAENLEQTPEVVSFIDFIKQSERGIVCQKRK